MSEKYIWWTLRDLVGFINEYFRFMFIKNLEKIRGLSISLQNYYVNGLEVL